MRILVMGAGAVGGYFGGRLLEAGRDVTFLVRPARAAQLAAGGLRIRSTMGDAHLPAPPTLLAADLARSPAHYDLILLSCKAYDLESAIASFAPAVGPQTAILPVLNGMRHLDALDAHFTPARVLGGQCIIAATLNPQREIVHLNENHSLSFGERNGAMSERVQAIAGMMHGAIFQSRPSTTILADMWEKWVFLATLAAGTCLMRAAVGDLAAVPGGSDFLLRLLSECQSIAFAAGYPPRQFFLDRIRQTLTAADSPLTASMLRDIEIGAPIEADHVIGDLIRRGANLTLLPIAYTHLKAYEARRTREKLLK